MQLEWNIQGEPATLGTGLYGVQRATPGTAAF